MSQGPDVLLQVLGHVAVVEPLGLLQRSEAPTEIHFPYSQTEKYFATKNINSPISGLRTDVALLQQELDAVELSLGRGHVQRRAAVVVAGAEVHALEVVPGNEFFSQDRTIKSLHF